MNESWIYVGEGGKHVLFSSQSPHKAGQLLRVRRDDIIGFSHSQSGTSSIGYLREVVKPLLGSHFDVPDILELSPEGARSLAEVARKSGRIPQSRLPSWCETSSENKLTSPVSSIQATLLRDYTRFHAMENACVPCDDDVSSPTWCVEIKPKAGYLAFSPLVDPLHRCKFVQSRLSIQQQLLLCGIVRKGWNNGTTHHPTGYNPIEMFSTSDDPSKIENELNALFENPQNNLKVWCDGKVLLTHGLRELSSNETPRLVSALATVLIHEGVLGKLLRIQMLDIIDADGAVTIYNRLVDLCDGNKDLVHDLVDSHPKKMITAKVAESGLLKNSPFQKPHSSALDQLVHEVEIFSSKTLTETEMDEVHNRCLNLVQGLSKSDCIYLLQNWLLSLTMCDVSIMISLTPARNAKSIMTGDVSGRWRCSQGQDENCHGMLNSENGDEWWYMVKVVDCDNKPVSKLAKRAEKEALIRHLSNNHENKQ